MNFRVLGPLEVLTAGEPVPVGSRMERALLAALLAHANNVVPTGQLAEALWGDDPPPSERNSLQTYVARLRRRLGPEASDVIVTRPPGYVIAVDPDRLDSLRFERVVRQARRSAGDDPAEALALLEEALGLWRGPAFAEFAADEFVRAEAARLEELRQLASHERIEALLILGRTAEAIEELEGVVAEQPLREAPHTQLMVALARAGRQVEALRTYQSYRRRLAEEVGLEPSAAMRELEGQILRQASNVAPAPRPRVAPPLGNIPRSATSFFGREREVTELVSALDRSRIVTLVGPGGVGKTRLALHIGRETGTSYGDGAWVVELASVSSGEAVPYAAASTLGLQHPHGENVAEALADFLTGRHVLLVLDNCEHLLEEVAKLVLVINCRCPGVTVLATSRERLGVDGEQVWPVPPLPVPGESTTDEETLRANPAVALFLDRANASRPDFHLDNNNAKAVVAICRGLDGLPLAIELAAARMHALTATDLAHRLGQRFTVLTSGRRSDHARHRTLQAVVDWSYGLLEDAERRVFERLSVFSGGWTLEQAVAVCSGDGVPTNRVVDLVASLVDKSMVTGPVGGGDRYGMLETLRQYGLDRLTTRDDEERVRRAHAEHFLTLAEEAAVGLTSPEESRWVQCLLAEIGNLREAHAWSRREGCADVALRLSRALHRFACWQMHDEMTSWAQATVDLPFARQHPLLPAVYGSSALGACRRGDLDGAVRLAEAGLQASAGPDDPNRSLSFEVLGAVASFRGCLEEAFAAYGEAARLARLSGDEGGLVYCLAGQALSKAYGADVEAALQLAGEIRSIAESNGSPSAMAWELYTRGESLLEEEPAQALAQLEKSLKLASEAGNTLVTALSLLSATSLRGRFSDPRDALRPYRDAIERWHCHRNWTQLWITLRNLVELLARVDAEEAAAVLWGGATASATAPPTFGPEATRLQAVKSELASKLGATFEHARQRGAALTDDEVVAFAVCAIDDVLARELQDGRRAGVHARP